MAKIHEGKMNITATYCVISPNDSKENNSNKEGYCIEYMNMGRSNQGNFQLITLLLGLDEQFDEKKIKKVYENLKYKYKKQLGLDSEDMKYEDYKVKVYKTLDKKIIATDIKKVTDIDFRIRVQLIGCILDIKEIEVLKALIKSFDLITPKDPNYTKYKEELKTIENMNELWYRKDKMDTKKIKKEVKGGSFRNIISKRIISRDSSKNIYPIYMKPSRKIKRKTKHRGGMITRSEVPQPTNKVPQPTNKPKTESPGSVSTPTPPTSSTPAPPPPPVTPAPEASTATSEAKSIPGTTQQEVKKPGGLFGMGWGILGGSRRRRKLKRRKTSKRH